MSYNWLYPREQDTDFHDILTLEEYMFNSKQGELCCLLLAYHIDHE